MSARKFLNRIRGYIGGLDDQLIYRPKAMLQVLANEPVASFNRQAANLGLEADAEKLRNLVFLAGNAGLGLVGGTAVAFAFNPLAGLALVGVGGVLAFRRGIGFFGAAYRANIAYALRDQALQLNDPAQVQKTIRDALSDEASFKKFSYVLWKRFDKAAQNGDHLKP